MAEEKKTNPHERIRVAKLCLNINPGGVGDPVTRAGRVLEQLTQQKPMKSRSVRSIPKFGIRRNDEIAAHVTVRGKKAMDILDKALRINDYQLPSHCFSSEGNFGFGVKAHIDLGLKYDKDIGVHGMDIYVVLEKDGNRIARRKHGQSRIGPRQRVTKQEAKDWYQQTFQGTLLSK